MNWKKIANGVKLRGHLKSKLTLSLGLFAIAGCDGPSELSDDIAATTALDDQPEVSLLFLSCTGTNSDPLGTSEITRKFSVPETTLYGDTIGEYRDQEKLYYHVCSPRAFNCVENVSDEIIDIRGSQIGGIQHSLLFQINRMTGEIDEKQMLDGRIISSFEGTCQKTSAPAEQSRKF